MKKYISIACITLLTIHFIFLIKDAGVFKKIQSIDLSCKSFTKILGPEDISITDNHMFISSTRLPYRYEFERGDIYYINLENNQSPELETAPISLAKKFNISPHGLYSKKINNKIHLWVIDHKTPYDKVHLFTFSKKKLSLIKTFISEKYINSNDIVGINANSFYLTHDHGSLNNILKKLENYTRIGKGYISLTGPNSVNMVATGLDFPNGIQKIKDNIYISQMLNNKISSFKIQKDFSLKESREYPVNYLPDNISIKNENTLIFASHPKAFSLKAHSENPKYQSPSVISELNINSGDEKIIYANDGTEFSAASVGVQYKNDLFIGNIYGKSFFKCKSM